MTTDPHVTALILSLAEKLAVVSRLLTAAADRCGWDSERVRELVGELERQATEDVETCTSEQQGPPMKICTFCGLPFVTADPERELCRTCEEDLRREYMPRDDGCEEKP